MIGATGCSRRSSRASGVPPEIAVVDAAGRLEHPGSGPGSCGFDALDVPWWSFTKTLIAAAVLRLAEVGRLDLDRPLEPHPFTTRQLLCHRSGLGDYGPLDSYQAAVAASGEPWSDATLLGHVPLDQLLFTPGTGFAYSNVGYLLLRRRLEGWHGAGLDVVLAEQVLEPLGLRRSRLARSPADMARTAFTDGHGYHPGWAFHGIVVGPAAEAALALHRLLSGDLLDPASRSAMLAALPVGGPLPGRPWRQTGYGLGLMIGVMRARGVPVPLQVFGHSAGGPGSVGAVYHAPLVDGCRTVAVFRPGSDEGVVEHLAAQVLAGGGQPLSR